MHDCVYIVCCISVAYLCILVPLFAWRKKRGGGGRALYTERACLIQKEVLEFKWEWGIVSWEGGSCKVPRRARFKLFKR